MSTDKLFIGIDGGGTSTKAKLINAQDETLGIGKSGPGSLRFGARSSFDAMIDACEKALKCANVPKQMLASINAAAGLAAFEVPSNARAITEIPHPFANFEIVSDCKIACLGAHQGSEGGIVIAGTGSVGYVITKNHSRRVAGLGFPVTDFGSGAHMGLASLQTAIQIHDKKAKSTEFKQEVLNCFGNNYDDVIERMVKANATDYALLAPIAIKYARIGDTDAIKIVNKTAKKIDELIQLVHFHGAQKICLMSGLAEPLKQYLSTDSTSLLVDPIGDAMDGAIIIAKKLSQ